LFRVYPKSFIRLSFDNVTCYMNWQAALFVFTAVNMASLASSDSAITTHTKNLKPDPGPRKKQKSKKAKRQQVSLLGPEPKTAKTFLTYSFFE